MVVRIVSVAVLGSIMLGSGSASAEPMQRMSAVVVCMPSEDQIESESDSSAQSLCLLRLAPWFEGTSMEFSPQIKVARRSAKRRWGAEFELHF